MDSKDVTANMEKEETYRITSGSDGSGTWFFTDCGNIMYHVGDDIMAYHGKLCPACWKKLYIRGSAEADAYLAKKKAG